MKEYNEVLKKVGLNGAEAKVYLALIELKESKTGRLCEKTEIPSSNIYPILNSLMKKGFVSYRLQNNTKIFLPSDPSIIDELFKEKENELQQERTEIHNLIKNLKEKQQVPSIISKYKYYEGLAGVRSMWLELTDSINNLSKDKPVKIYGAKKGSYEGLLAIYDDFNKLRYRKKIGYRLILSPEDRKHGDDRKKQLSEIKYLDLKNEGEVGIIGEKVFLQYITGKTPVAFLIEDKVLTKTFEQMFDQIWEFAKK